jgi:drug/metabolite transporter (DMT)-like permease
LNRWQLFFILAGVNLLWAPVNLAVKNLNSVMSPATMSSIRWVCFTGVFWAVISIPAVRNYFKIVMPKGWDILRAVLLGMLLVGPSHVIYYSALKMTTSSQGAVLNTTGPIWTALLAVFILHEKITPRRWLAILTGFLGTYAIIFGRNLPSFNANNAIGNAVYLCAVLMETLAMVLAIKLIKRSSGPGTLAYEVIGTALGSLLVPVIAPGLAQHQLGTMNPAAFGSMLYLIFGAGLICFGLWYWIAEKAPVSLMVITIGIQAPAATLLGWYFLNEKIGLAFLVGTLMILGALLLAGEKEEPVPEPSKV